MNYEKKGEQEINEELQKVEETYRLEMAKRKELEPKAHELTEEKIINDLKEEYNFLKGKIQYLEGLVDEAVNKDNMEEAEKALAFIQKINKRIKELEVDGIIKSIEDNEQNKVKESKEFRDNNLLKSIQDEMLLEMKGISFELKEEKSPEIIEALNNVHKAYDEDHVDKIIAAKEAVKQIILKETPVFKMTINGKETLLFTEISEPMNYEDASKWCENKGKRLPTIAELEYLFNLGGVVKESFKELIFWSSTIDPKTKNHMVFDFKDERKEIRSDDEQLHVTRAINDMK